MPIIYKKNVAAMTSSQSGSPMLDNRDGRALSYGVIDELREAKNEVAIAVGPAGRTPWPAVIGVFTRIRGS